MVNESDFQTYILKNILYFFYVAFGKVYEWLLNPPLPHILL